MTISHSENVILDGTLLSQLRSKIEDVFQVDRIETPREAAKGTIFFVGELLMADSERAYDLIADRWRAHNYTPMLRRHQNQVALIAQPGVVIPTPSNPWINLALIVVTLFSILFTGATLECQCLPKTVPEWLTGLPMMLAMLGILLAHEFGHYFAARYHKVAVTLPYFIPLPLISPVGTLGAFIQLRSPFKTKKQLFDIGVAGPLAGLLVALPLVLWGVANAAVKQIDRSEPAVLEGNSIFYLAIKYWAHGELLPSFSAYSDLPFIQEFLRLLAGIIPPGGGVDIWLQGAPTYSVAFAAWFGLFVTAMNLLPVGQLDGGHIVYCLLGDRARWLGTVLVGAMLLAGILWWPGWVLWAVLVFFVIGPGHPPPLNDLVPLGLPRKIIAYITIFIFIIMFMPNPLQPL